MLSTEEIWQYGYTKTNGVKYWYLKVTPKAKRNAIEDIIMLQDKTYLKVKVTAVPTAGQANTAVIHLFSEVLHVARSSLTICSGQTTSLKILSYQPL